MAKASFLPVYSGSANERPLYVAVSFDNHQALWLQATDRVDV